MSPSVPVSSPGRCWQSVGTWIDKPTRKATHTCLPQCSWLGEGPQFHLYRVQTMQINFLAVFGCRCNSTFIIIFRSAIVSLITDVLFITTGLFSVSPIMVDHMDAPHTGGKKKTVTIMWRGKGAKLHWCVMGHSNGTMDQYITVTSST